MSGQLTIAEMYEQVDQEILSNGHGVVGPKHKSMANMAKSVGGDEIDSECRTEDDEYHNVSANDEADKQSK